MFDLWLSLHAPLSHGAFGPRVGNATPIRREPVVSLDGAPLVPCVSGNALRGVMRRAIMREMFDVCDLHRGSSDLRPKVWDRLYAALANGGHLDGTEHTVSPDARRALRAALPPVSVFGASLYSYLLPGRLQVGLAWPVCQELEAVGLVRSAPGSLAIPVCAEDLVSETTSVRHIDRDEHDPEESGVTPMPVTIEALSTGAVLHARITLQGPGGTPDPLEAGIVLHALRGLHHIGGKSAQGFGVVSPHIETSVVTRDWPAWLREHRDEVRAALVDLGERCTPMSTERKRKGAA